MISRYVSRKKAVHLMEFNVFLKDILIEGERRRKRRRRKREGEEEKERKRRKSGRN